MESVGSSVSRMVTSPGFKFFLICGLVLALLIPMVFVWFLVDEREDRAKEVRADVASEWGRPQFVNGPFLIVPYTVLVVTGEGEKRVEKEHERHAVFLPETLNIRGKVTTKVLHRSIYDVPVYTGSLDFKGNFKAPDISEVAPDAHAVRWREAVLALAISDVSGLRSAEPVVIDGGSNSAFEPSLGGADARISGIHAPLAALTGSFDDAPTVAGPSSTKGMSFQFRLTFNGSSELMFAPVAANTDVELLSDWPDPSFTGAFLPTDRTVESDNFSVRWQVPNLARSLPQAWSLSGQGLTRLAPYKFGVSLFIPVDIYALVTRAAKYAMMFLATAFMAVFVLELRSSRHVHAVQYLFVGLAMVFFYVLLLSLAEHVGFLWAYVLSAVATGGMLSVYVGRVQASFAKGLAMLVLFLGLYGLLYLILQLEDYALLAGAIAGFVMLTVVMFSTLKVDWSGLAEQRSPAPQQSG